MFAPSGLEFILSVWRVRLPSRLCEDGRWTNTWRARALLGVLEPCPECFNFFNSGFPTFLRFFFMASMIFEATWDVIEAPSWTLQLIDNEAFTLRFIRERDVGLTKDLLKKLNCLKQNIRKDPLLRSFCNIVPGKRLIKGALHCTFTEAERYALFWLEIDSTYNTYTPWTFQDGSLEKRWLQQKVCLYDNMRPLFHHPTHQFQECKNFFRPVSSTFTPAFRPPQCWLWSPSPSTKSRPKLMVYGFPDFQFYTNEILKGKKKPCRFFLHVLRRIVK